MSELERSYRRLLRAYPGYYRGERGLEILTTLMDAAEPGQVRPSFGEAAYLLMVGLRHRFVPPTRIGKIATGIVTIWAAIVLSGAGAWAVWAFANPAKPDLAAFSDGLVGQQASSANERSGFADEVSGSNLLAMAYSYKATGEFQLTDEGWDGERPVPVGQHRDYEQVHAMPTVLAKAYQHLTSAGWRTGALIQPGWDSQDYSPSGLFWASRDGVLLRVSGYDDDQPRMTVNAYPVEPGGVLAGAIGGFILGLIVVGQAMTWLAHRFTWTPTPLLTRWLILLLGLAAIIAAGVNTMDNVLSMVPEPALGRGTFLAVTYMYPLANQIANPLAVSIISVALTGCLGSITWASRRRQRGPVDAAAATGEVAES